MLNDKQKRVRVFGLSMLVISAGLALIFTSAHLFKFIIRKTIVLKPDTHISDLWKHYPELVPTDVYLFNLTNPEEIRNKSVKLKFQQVGPYRFMMDSRKTNITWNDNGTVTFTQLKYWYYNKEDSAGDLEDKIIGLHVTALGLSHLSRTWNYMERRAVSFTLRSISPTIHISRTVNELLITGYPDTLMNMAKTLSFFVKIQVPRLGWFHARNGSTDFEGVYNIKTGINSGLGRINTWNYWTQTPYFAGDCRKVDGFLDLFDSDSIQDTIKIFSTDLCRSIILQYDGKKIVKGIMGNKYSLDDYMLDNGTKYPENKCYCNGDCFPSGVINISSCQHGMPTFFSLPHFYKADPHYSNLIEGMRPKKEKHEFYVVLEHNTGVLLEVKASVQLSMYVHSVLDISLFENVSNVLFPMLWLQQQVKLPDSEILKLKLLLNVPIIFISTGILMIVAGLTSTIYHFTKCRKDVYSNQEDIPLTTDCQYKIMTRN